MPNICGHLFGRHLAELVDGCLLSHFVLLLAESVSKEIGRYYLRQSLLLCQLGCRSQLDYVIVRTEKRKDDALKPLQHIKKCTLNSIQTALVCLLQKLPKISRKQG